LHSYGGEGKIRIVIAILGSLYAKTIAMRYILLLFSIVVCGCESQQFESDKRQIMAKDEIRSQVKNRRSFDVVSFKEDTLDTYTDSSIKRPIRYTLNFVYKDSTGALLGKSGEVIFTPDGKSILHSHIIENQ
jgi:hypothetical protein